MNRHFRAPIDDRGAEKHHQAVANQFYVEARQLVADLYPRNERRYWLDFLASTISAYVLVSAYLTLPFSAPVAWISFVAGSILIYRASMFVHEIVHLPHDEMKQFRRCWNFLAGVPMMIPSFSYTNHVHHHSSRHYGTAGDAEYLPLASGTIWGLLAFLAQIFFQPILVFSRYLILTPISFLHPALRRWTMTHASALTINFRYHNDARPEKWTREDTFWELFTWIRTAIMIALVVAGIMPMIRLPKLLFVAMFVLTLNHIRTMAAHRYTNDGGTISHLDQFLDSTNIQGNWLTELICPLGLRYHALHHLFPGLPYHNLGVAHVRLSRELPADSIYHDATYPNLRSVLGELWTSIVRQQPTDL